MPGDFRCLRCEYSRAYLTTPSAREAAGALGTRHSPRPLRFQRDTWQHQLGASIACEREGAFRYLKTESSNKSRAARSRRISIRVVPANAGTHNHQCLSLRYAGAAIHLTASAAAMGPGIRRDDGDVDVSFDRLSPSPKEKPSARGVFNFNRGTCVQCARIASSSSATMLVILIIGFTAGPAVSLGSPMLSPVTAALWASEFVHSRNSDRPAVRLLNDDVEIPRV